MKKRSILMVLAALLFSASLQCHVMAEEGQDVPIAEQQVTMEKPDAEQLQEKAEISSWQDLKDAIENVTEDTTISISGDLEKEYKDTQINIPAGVNITLVGNNVKIIRPSKSEVGEFYVSDSAELTLQGDFEIEAKNYAQDKGSLAYANFVEVSETGSLSIEGSLTAHTSDGFFNGRYGKKGFIYCKGNMVMSENSSIKGWTVYDTTSMADNRNAAVVIDGADANFTMNGGEITGNYNVGSNGVAGAAVQVHGGASFMMNAGNIHHNGVIEQPSSNCIYGSGVFVRGENSSFKMAGGSIYDNDGMKGAGVYISSGTKNTRASLEMTGGKIENNDITNVGKSGCDGGGIYAKYADVNIKTKEGADNISISKNGTKDFGSAYRSVQSSGGGIYAEECTIAFENVCIENNTACGNNGQGGAGVYLKNSDATIIGGTISSNQGGDVNQNIWGGGLRIDGTGNTLVKDVCFENNTVSSNSDYEWNIGYGGAIMVDGTDSLTVEDCIIRKNHASGSGGGIYVNEGTVNIKGNTVIENNTCNNNRAEWENYLGEGICIAPGATVNLYDQVRVDKTNTVGLEENRGEVAVLAIANQYSGIDKEHPVMIESMQREVEKLPDVQGTPLVKFLEEAGGEAAAQNADENHHFVASSYMPESLQIGQSEENKDTLTYVSNRSPVINAEDKTLTVGDKFEPLKDVTATDKEDGDLTSKVEVVNSNVDTSKAGVYEVTYKVTDNNGASATKTIQVTVKAKEATSPGSGDEQKPDKGGDASKVDTSKADTSNTDVPKTGDTANILLWGMVEVISLVGVIMVLFFKRRRSE